MSIHIHHAGQQSGPHSLAEIQARLQAGTLLPTDLAWYEGLPSWIPVAQIPGVTLPGTSAPPRIEAPPFAPAAAPVSSQAKALLIAGGVGSIVLALVVFGVGATWLGEGRESNLPVVGLFMLPLSVAIGVASLQFFFALSHNPTGCCRACGHVKPTIWGSLHRHFGAIILMFHRHVSGHLCKDCIGKTFWEFTPVTLAAGWWGMMSFFITPLVAVNNIAYYLRSRFMKG